MVRGEPKELDVLWRPVVRVLLYGPGLGLGALLAWLGLWVWAPLPFVLAVLAYEVIFWIRGDRPLKVTLEGPLLTLVDARQGTSRRVDLRGARIANLGIRKGKYVTDRAFLTLYDDVGVLLVAELDTLRRDWPDHAADLSALQAVLGGRAGLLRGLGPPESLIRQTLIDPDGVALAHLLAHLPAAITERCALRLWRGTAPEVDFMGHHAARPYGILRLSAPGAWILQTSDGEERGVIGDGPSGHSSRDLELFDLGAQERTRARLPLLVWSLHPDLSLAMPAPVAGHNGPKLVLTPDSLHTHLPEAANLIWWLLRTLPPEQIPEGLRQAIADSRITGERLPPTLAQHLPST